MKLLLWSLVVLLSGCAATVKQGSAGRAVSVPAESAAKIVLNMTGPARSTGSRDWEAFKGEWRAAFRRQANLASLAYDDQEGAARPTGEPGTLLAVYVDDYRYLSPGARYGFGIMTGNAYIESKIAFSDLARGGSYGEQSYNTSSSAWQGVFSAMTEKQVDALAAEVVKEVRRHAGQATAGMATTPPGTAAPPASAMQTQPAGPPAAAPSSRPAAPTLAPVSARPAAPTKAAATPGPAPLGYGTSSFEVEHLAEVRACQAAPKAVLLAKGPGFENYSVACSKGDAIFVRCDLGNCRVLKQASP